MLNKSWIGHFQSGADSVWREARLRSSLQRNAKWRRSWQKRLKGRLQHPIKCDMPIRRLLYKDVKDCSFEPQRGCMQSRSGVYVPLLSTSAPLCSLIDLKTKPCRVFDGRPEDCHKHRVGDMACISTPAPGHLCRLHYGVSVG